MDIEDQQASQSRPQNRQTVAAEAVSVGCKLQVLKTMDGESFWRDAEVLAIRLANNGGRGSGGSTGDERAGAVAMHEFYVHYVNFNKRLDEWVPEDRVNLSTVLVPKVEPPKKDGKKKATTTASKAGVVPGPSKQQSKKSSRSSRGSASAVNADEMDNRVRMQVINEEDLLAGDAAEDEGMSALAFMYRSHTSCIIAHATILQTCYCHG